MIDQLMESFLKLLALIVVLVIALSELLWRKVKPYLGYFEDIHQTIDLHNLNVVYVLQTFLKCWLMMVLWVWQIVGWLADWVIGLLPSGRRLQTEAVKYLDHQEHCNRFLLRPFRNGLFSRR